MAFSYETTIQWDGAELFLEWLNTHFHFTDDRIEPREKPLIITDHNYNIIWQGTEMELWAKLSEVYRKLFVEDGSKPATTL